MKKSEDSDGGLLDRYLFEPRERPKNPKAVKKKFGYQAHTPTCNTCVYMIRPKIELTMRSNTVWVNSHCGLGGFTVTKQGCCDRWVGKNGDTIG